MGIVKRDPKKANIEKLRTYLKKQEDGKKEIKRDTIQSK